MHAEPKFAKEYTQFDRIRFAVIGTLVGAVVFLVCQTWLFPWFQEFIMSAPCRKVLGIEGLTVLWYALFVGLPLQAAVLVMVIFSWRGYKILRDGQYPPFKEKVLRPTRIRRGSTARVIGYLHFSASMPLLALAIWGAFQAEEMTRKMRPTANVCKDIPAIKLPAVQGMSAASASTLR